MEMTIDVEQWFYYAMDVLNGIVHSYRGNRDKNKHKEQSPTNCTSHGIWRFLFEKSLKNIKKIKEHLDRVILHYKNTGTRRTSVHTFQCSSGSYRNCFGGGKHNVISGVPPKRNIYKSTSSCTPTIFLLMGG
jgi:hypothetical protein